MEKLKTKPANPQAPAYGNPDLARRLNPGVLDRLRPTGSELVQPPFPAFTGEGMDWCQWPASAKAALERGLR